MDTPATVGLKGGGVIRDHGNRITVKGASEDALRVIITAAQAKGWTGLSVRGSEEYLKMAERIGAVEGFTIQRRGQEAERPTEATVDQTSSNPPLPNADNKGQQL